ncbi:RDD family protein [Cryomorpha ignava]|uniref:RDD family protein n=1 Tax=Cryomorpha ignava TaxID=101383 RepID=A0A7K3WVQ3_9FLAO|nr:RDD family protein [Cryomorpha ignava]NEN25628.1 RDD family protein [Cryomorpha ignava]
MTTEILDEERLKSIEAPSDFVLAERSKRFVNLLVDTIIFYIFFIAVAVVFILLDDILGSSYTLEMLDAPILGRLLSAVFYFLFFVCLEWALKGRTVGKYITNTKTVMHDGSPLTFSAILKKSGSRLVPFEAFSFFGSDSRGIHDRWSDTAVVDLKKVKVENSRNALSSLTDQGLTPAY